MAPELLRIWRVREASVRLALSLPFERYVDALSPEQLRKVVVPEVILFANL